MSKSALILARPVYTQGIFRSRYRLILANDKNFIGTEEEIFKFVELYSDSSFEIQIKLENWNSPSKFMESIFYFVDMPPSPSPKIQNWVKGLSGWMAGWLSVLRISPIFVVISRLFTSTSSPISQPKVRKKSRLKSSQPSLAGTQRNEPQINYSVHLTDLW